MWGDAAFNNNYSCVIFCRQFSRIFSLTIYYNYSIRLVKKSSIFADNKVKALKDKNIWRYVAILT